MSVTSFILGDYTDAYQFNEIASLKRQIEQNEIRRSFRCPVCGNTNLKKKERWIYTKWKEKKEEEKSIKYTPDSRAGKHYFAGFEDAKKYADLTIEELEIIIKKINENIKFELDLPEKLFKHRIYREGFIDTLNSFIDVKRKNTKKK